MEIVGYNEEKEILRVKYNTNDIWEYHPISKQSYIKILKDTSLNRVLKYFIRRMSIVGVKKEVK